MTPAIRNYFGLFDNWLNFTFADFYLVTLSKTGSFFVVEHGAEVDNQQFVQLLINLFPDRDLYSAGQMRTDTEFTFKFQEGSDIIIRPFDDDIYHTEYVKEEKHG